MSPETTAARIVSSPSTRPPATRCIAMRAALPVVWSLAIAIIFSLGVLPGGAFAELVLNEFMADNDATLADEMGDFDDWIEILNTGPSAVDLTGMFLTDNLIMTIQWTFPPLLLQVGERTIIWADNEQLEGPLHANFKLNDAGEELGLFDRIVNGNGAIDTIVFGEQAGDVSYGRFPDGSGPWTYMPTATPAAPNVEGGNVPPRISQTAHTPVSPAQAEVATVTSYIRDLDGLITATALFYDAGSGFIATGMFDDGLHGDGAPGDSIYGGEIPGFPTGTSVAYYVECVDDVAAVTTDPADAPASTYGYMVDYVAPLLFINEFMASNDTTIADNFGEFEDWVEIYNGGPDPVNLGGLALSDELAVPGKYIFPAVILDPQSFLLIWCDNDPEQGVFHADFKLAAIGEQIGLFASAAEGFAAIDTLTYGQQVTDVSYGREPDGGATWRFYADPTPGAQNTEPNAIAEESGAPAVGFRLEPPRPNPASAIGGTEVLFGLETAGRVVVRLYDVQGRVLGTILDDRLPAGDHRLRLDGNDGAGRPLVTGVYFLRLETAAGSRSERLVIMR